jgi:hypothetical protein
MLGRLFPRVIDNRFRGQWLGYWLMAPILILKFGIAGGSILTPSNAAKADAIDLSTYSAAALQGAMASTALIGLLHLCIALFCLLAMIRYRALVPLIYLWLLLEFFGRRLVLDAYPIGRESGPVSGSMINLALVAMMVIGFALSLWPRRSASDPASA